MKTLLFILCFCSTMTVLATNKTYQKLIEINKCWTEQKDISVEDFIGSEALSERAWISLHLSLVEQTLRARSISHLNSIQQKNRAKCLEILHSYWQAGSFPINEEYAIRTPIFIDKHNNFCAVGFLIKETGNEAISRMISSKTNLAYVREMDYPELGIWANENGFSIDELAWIQPSYPPESQCVKVGNGVDGFVQEMFVDTTTQQLFVGGNFYEADKAFVANNIAYVTENAGNYTWHKMGNGVNGQVNAITKYDDKIFVGGSFDSASGIYAHNIAFWDGSSWHNAGCIDGTVNDLAVFENKLFAVGSFSACLPGAGKNFAMWNGSDWQMISGISGNINTLEATNDYLVLGGKFNYDTALNVNAIKWNTTSSFEKFPNKIVNEVMDFELYKDTLHAVCKTIIASDTIQLFQKLTATGWVSFFASKPYWFFDSDKSKMSLNTLCKEDSSINIGGYFSSVWGFTVAKNSIAFGNYWLEVDSTVNKMILFKKELILGGKFKTGMEYTPFGGTKVEINGITKRKPWSLSIPQTTSESKDIIISPNPTNNYFEIKRLELSNIASIQIFDVLGRQVARFENFPINHFDISNLASGLVLVKINCKDNTIKTARLLKN